MMIAQTIRKVAVIVGCGSKHDKGGLTDFVPSVRFGLGGALSLAFAKSSSFDHVLLLSRRQELLDLVAAEVRIAAGEDAVTTQVCDVTDDASVQAAFETAVGLGSVECVVFNVANGFPKDPDTGETLSFDQLPAPAAVDAAQLTAGFDVGVGGCVRVANRFVPHFVEQGRGSFLASGATMGLRGGPGFAALSPIKFALRSYCQSMSNAYHKDNVHVAYVVIDGVIDSPATRPWGGNVMLMDPEHLAGAYVALHEQPKTVWSSELQLTPSQDSIGMRL